MTLKQELSKYKPIVSRPLFGGKIEVIRFKREKAKWKPLVAEFDTMDQVNEALEAIEVSMVLDKIARFHNHQEHIKRDIVPQMWANSVESLRKLATALNILERESDLTRLDLAGHLDSKIIEWIVNIKPGKKSKFYDTCNELVADLEEWTANILKTETTEA